MLNTFVVHIKSPAWAPDETFHLTKLSEDEIKDDNRDLYECLNFIIFDVKELAGNKSLLNGFTGINWTSWKSVSAYCNLYNTCISELRNNWTATKTRPDFYQRRAKMHQLKYILSHCYNRAIEDPDKLNQYPPFSPQVYGETSFELIAQMIEFVSIGKDDTFIDLGSGVGQVVLQVAASCDVKFSYGIEKADYPAQCAIRLDKEFKRWMAFYGKKYQPYEIVQGDFLSDECAERIISSTIVFANNFAFGPEVDHQLKLRFANLKEGAKVIASKAFCSLNFRITDRKLDDIGSIMNVTCLNPIHDAVSWTDKPFSYYVHTIDRSSLEQYFARLKNPKDCIGVKRGGDRKSRGCATRNGTVPETGGSAPPSISGCRKNQKHKPKEFATNTRFPDRNLIAMTGSGSSQKSTPDSIRALSPSQSACCCDHSEESSRSSSTSSSTLHGSTESGCDINRGYIKNHPQVNSVVPSSPQLSPKSQRLRRLRKSTAEQHLNDLVQSPPGSSITTATPTAAAKKRSLVTTKATKEIDLLHRQTILSYHRNDVVAGVGYRLDETSWSLTLDELRSPNNLQYQFDPAVGHLEEPVPLALEQHLELTKQMFMRQFRQMQSPEFAAQVQKQLDYERARQVLLRERTRALDITIQRMHTEGRNLLTTFTKRLGILVSSPATFFAEARKLIKQHRNLEEKICELRSEVSRLSDVNQELVRRHQDQMVSATTATENLHRRGPPHLVPSPPLYNQQHKHHRYHSKSNHHRKHPPRLVPESLDTASDINVASTKCDDQRTEFFHPPPPSILPAAYQHQNCHNFLSPPNLSPIIIRRQEAAGASVGRDGGGSSSSVHNTLQDIIAEELLLAEQEESVLMMDNSNMISTYTNDILWKLPSSSQQNRTSGDQHDNLDCVSPDKRPRSSSNERTTILQSPSSYHHFPPPPPPPTLSSRIL